MADFNFVVDTYPMAESMDTVRGSVAGVNGAVVAMQSAVVLAQQKASKEICKNVDNGFFVLMSSQLSQKLARAASIISSKLMLMKHFSEDLNHIQKLMQDDYNRICRRYIKTFRSIDDALKSRVTQLDKAAMKIGSLQKSFSILNANESSKALIYDEDISKVSNLSVSATVKIKTARTLSVIAENVCDTANYTNKVKHCLKSENLNEKAEKLMPMIFLQSDSMFDPEISIDNVYTPDSQVIKNKDVLVNSVMEASKDFAWKDIDENNKTKIQSLVLKKCADENIDDRIANEIQRLLDLSNLQVAGRQNE